MQGDQKGLEDSNQLNSNNIHVGGALYEVEDASQEGDSAIPLPDNVDGRPRIASVVRGRLLALKAMKHVKVGGDSNVMELSTPQTLRDKIYSLLDPGVPTWNERAAVAQTAISMSVFAVIVISVTCFCIESLPQYYEKGEKSLVIIEMVCIFLFTIEFLLRVLTVNNLKKFFKDPLNWIDLISILPWYFTQIMSVSGQSGNGAGSLIILRVVRLIRVFRVLKLSKYSTNLQLVAMAVARSMDALSLLLFLIIICLLLFSSAMFIAEQSEVSFSQADEAWYTDEQSKTKAPFQSIPGAFWWCIVTITTVGYGDSVPVSVLGKCVASLCMMCGILVAALPVIMVGNNFNAAVTDHKKKTKRHTEMLKRALGQESNEEDEPPTMEDCSKEITKQISRFKGDLSREFERFGLSIGFSEPLPRHGLPLGCISCFFRKSNGMVPVYLTSYGNDTKPVEADALSPRNRPQPGRSLKHLVKKFNQRNREAKLAEQQKNKMSATFQFRYEPQLQITKVYSMGDEEDGPRLLIMQIEIDSQETRDAAFAELKKWREYPGANPTNIYCREIETLRGWIPGLENFVESAEIVCDYQRPPNNIQLSVHLDSPATLQQVQCAVPYLVVEIEVTYTHCCSRLPTQQLLSVPVQSIGDVQLA
eukprot:TRINITY_DN2505_c3_g1_i1.p1 TRINITY_DN2505_c3_g1~~TRINITY_DN2505_c3_g1_i1.p1  ORF type:complete len:646 (+),score=49.20 TRINITY_DN2505_c3_g1_i1:130-2067(+)